MQNIPVFSRECRLPITISWNVFTTKHKMLTIYFRNKNIPLIFSILTSKSRLKFILLSLKKSNESQNSYLGFNIFNNISDFP